MKAKATMLVTVVTLLVISLSGSVGVAAAQTSGSTLQAPSAATTAFFIPIVAKNGTTAASTVATTTSAVSTGSTTGTGSTTSTATTGTGSSSYSPQPGDALLTRDKVFLDFTKSHLIVTSSSPLSVSAYLVGNLPDPCHLLRITSSFASATNTISIQVYSLYKPGTACATVLQPFAVTYPLGTFAPGLYTVTVNGSKLGSFGSSPATSATSTK